MPANDIETTLKTIRKTAEHWLRCQALASIALHIKDSKSAEKVISESFEAAAQLSEPNRAVKVSSWPLRALVLRAPLRVNAAVNKLLDDISREPDALRRADALFMLWESVYANKQGRGAIFSSLLRSSESMHGWRRARMFRNMAIVSAIDDMPLALTLIEKIEDQSQRKRAERALLVKGQLGPHEFFPHYKKPQMNLPSF